MPFAVFRSGSGVSDIKRSMIRAQPCPSFPCFFWNSLFFLPGEDFLVFLSVFPFFSRDFRGSAGIKNPCFFGGFPCRFPKKQGKEGQGSFRLSGMPLSAPQSTASDCPTGGAASSAPNPSLATSPARRRGNIPVRVCMKGRRKIKKKKTQIPRGPGEASWCREAKIAARQDMTAQLPRNYPHHGVNFEREKKCPLLWGIGNLGGI